MTAFLMKQNKSAAGIINLNLNHYDQKVYSLFFIEYDLALYGEL